MGFPAVGPMPRLLYCALLVVAASAEDSEDVPVPEASSHLAEQDSEDVPVPEASSHLGWQDTDPVTVYYAEFLLASWVLAHAPWNAYHSAVGFINNRTGEKCIFDYSPVDSSSVMNMVSPVPRMESLWRGLLLGEVNMDWRDDAKVSMSRGWPKRFTNFVQLAVINGSLFNAYADVVAEEMLGKFTRFRPLEVVSKVEEIAPGGVAMRSRMCHDFVTDSLWVLHELGAEFQPERAIFRDHIMMYAESIRALGAGGLHRGRDGRQWMRYLRSLQVYLEEVKQQFTHARTALLAAWRLGVPVFVRDGDGEEHFVQLVPPFINYCYLPLAIPPKHHEPFGKLKLCALGMQANMTNTTTQWAGQVVAAEERLDRPEVMISLALAVLASLVMGSAPIFPPAAHAKEA